MHVLRDREDHHAAGVPLNEEKEEGLLPPELPELPELPAYNK